MLNTSLNVISKFLDRPGLKNPDVVEKIQDRVRQALQQQMSAQHRQEMAAFAKLLLKIPDLRTLNTLHSEKLLGRIPPY